MPIYYDPTEARSNTRMPQSVLDMGSAVEGLEKHTGADMLISPIDKPALSVVTDKLPHLVVLEKHCRVGLLVQRKSGRDMVSSIPRLGEILDRMFHWTQHPWLVMVGSYLPNRDGCVVVDGQETRWSWASLDGAIDSWQIRGGYYRHFRNNSMFERWVASWVSRFRVKGISDTDSAFGRAIAYRNTLSGEEGGWQVLSAFGDVGPVRAKAIWEYCGSSLGWALSYCSMPDAWDKGTPDGVGKGTLESIRRQLECGGMALAMISGDKEEER